MENNNLELKQSKKSNRKIILSEFFATILLTYLLIWLDCLYIQGHNLAYWLFFEFAAGSNNTKGAGFAQIAITVYVIFVVGLVILIFERWSCNANPSISLYMYVSKQCNGKLTFYKIMVQFAGAVVAGAIGILTALASNGLDVANPLGGFFADGIASFGTSGQIGHFFSAAGTAFFVEFFAAVFVCLFLFSKGLSEKIKFLFIIVYFGIGIAAMLPTGVVGFNPARSFGPAIYHDVYIMVEGKLTIYNSELLMSIVFIVAPLLGVLLFNKCSNVYEEYILPKIRKWALNK